MHPSLTRPFVAAAMLLSCAATTDRLAAQPSIQPSIPLSSSWSCGNVYYVSNQVGNNANAGTRLAPWQTISYAVTQAQAITPVGSPITINVMKGTYNVSNGEAFPIRLPARGIKLEAFEPTVTVSGQIGIEVLLVDRAGPVMGACGKTPNSIIRGLTLTGGLRGISIYTALSGPPASTPDRVYVHRCKIVNNNNIGVEVRTGPNFESQHIFEENEIAFNRNPNSFGKGVLIFDEGIFQQGDVPAASSVLLRANNIHDNEVGIEVLGNDSRTRPRILTNIISTAEWGVSLRDCRAQVVNNTQAYGRAYSQGTNVYGFLISGSGSHVLANNIIWNPLSFASSVFAAASVTQISGGIFTANSNWILGTAPASPQFVAAPGDLHVLPTSPVIDAGNNSFVGPIASISTGTFSSRVDFGLDVDGESRISDFAQDATPDVDIGADERTDPTGTNVTVSSPQVDPFGNVHTSGTATTINVQVTAAPNAICGIFFWLPTGQDTILMNRFQPPLGSWRIPGTGLRRLVAGVANGSGVLSATMVVNPALLGLEEEFFLQGAALGTGGAGTVSNRLLVEVNE